MKTTRKDKIAFQCKPYTFPNKKISNNKYEKLTVNLQAITARLKIYTKCQI